MTTAYLYILKGHEPVPEPDRETWQSWMYDTDRHVALTEQGDTRVSTVFTGLNHNFGNGPPLLFETMAFKGTAGWIGVPGQPGIDIQRAMFDGQAEHYATWAEAEAGHKRWLKKVFKEAR